MLIFFLYLSCYYSVYQVDYLKRRDDFFLRWQNYVVVEAAMDAYSWRRSLICLGAIHNWDHVVEGSRWSRS